MVQTETQLRSIVEEYVKLLQREGITVEKVYLYGSYARGSAHADSDIDLVIISKDFDGYDSLELLEMLSQVAWKCDAPLEVLGYTPEEIRKNEGKSIFWDEIRSTCLI